MSKSVLAHMRWGKSRMSAILVKSVHSSAAAAGTHVFTVYVHCTVYTHRTHTHTNTHTHTHTHLFIRRESSIRTNHLA